MKRKNILLIAVVLALIIVCIFGSMSYYNHSKTDGSTLESREKILDKSGAGFKNQKWTIATEQELDGYIISGAYSTDGKATIAIFEPVGNGKYGFMASENRSSDNIFITNAILDGIPYDLIWFPNAQTEYAEIVYTIDGQSQDAVRYDTADLKLICRNAPAKEYTIHVTYYDSEGNEHSNFEPSGT